MSFILDFGSGLFEDNALDDSVDRANRQWMTCFLLFIVVFLGLRQFVGDPIRCFTPQYFGGGQEAYVDGYCWTASTYQLLNTKYDPLRPHGAIQAVLNAGGTGGGLFRGANDAARSNPATDHADHRLDHVVNKLDLSGSKRFVSYYQWIPLIVTLQASLFVLPYKLWKSFSGDGGVDIEQILIAAKKLGECHGDIHERHLTLTNMCEHFDRFIKVTKPPPGFDPDTCSDLLPGPIGKTFGLHIHIFYSFRFLVMKCLYVANLVIQLYGMHVFLGTDLLLHGINVFHSIVFKSEWTSSIRFPINTLCQFRGQPQVHGYLISYNVHCVLPTNLYNDKFFAVLSLLYFLLLLMTGFSLLKWIVNIVIKANREGLIKKHLILNYPKLGLDVNDAGLHRLERVFIEEELKVDGCFVLWLIDANLSSAVTDQVVVRLWTNFLERQRGDGISDCKLERMTQSIYLNGDELRLRMKTGCGLHENASTTLDLHQCETRIDPGLIQFNGEQIENDTRKSNNVYIV